MSRHSRCSTSSVAWPERWPVFAPAAGSGLAMGATAFAITEGDWIAAVVFLAPAALLGIVAGRNRRVSCASPEVTRVHPPDAKAEPPEAEPVA